MAAVDEIPVSLRRLGLRVLNLVIGADNSYITPGLHSDGSIPKIIFNIHAI